MALVLSPSTQQLVDKLFEPGDRAEAARRLVQDCGNNLPFCQKEDEYKMERVRFAVLRLSLGDLDDVDKAIKNAQSDWRDVLVAARFGESTTAHREWAERVLAGNPRSMVIILMGVTGAGKTTVGSLLARELGWMYYEADNFLSNGDFDRVVRGEPLTEQTVEAWLDKLRARIDKYLARKQNAIIACSALQESYRRRLRVSDDVRLIYLRGTHALIQERQSKRKASLPFMQRLAYESSILEEPTDALVVDVERSPQEIVKLIRRELEI